MPSFKGYIKNGQEQMTLIKVSEIGVRDFQMILNHRIANPLICQHYVCIRNRRNALPSIRVNSEASKEFFTTAKEMGFYIYFIRSSV